MRLAIIMILGLLLGVRSYGEEAGRDSITVSLITCSPGPEIYELCGHEAIRVRGERIDSVWNYGTFDFAEPNFVYRFVKGETDYMLSAYPFSWFMPEYIIQGREVTEQDLNLTQDEAWRLLGKLREEAKPENRKYRYNYVRDNCATRILDRLEQSASSPVIYKDTLGYGTFRREMRSFHRNYPWYQFGIDLALGGGLDREIRSRDEMFVPVVMKDKVEQSHFADGRPLVKATRILSEGRPGASLDATPWYLTPNFASAVLFIILSILSLWMAKRRRIIRIIYTIWFGICGIGGCVIAFLVFVSTHEATSPNLLLIWLNPLQLIFALCIWWRAAVPAARAMAWYNMIAVGCLLIVWPFQNQSANTAFFPLMAISVMLGALYAIISPGYCYNNKNEKVSNIGTVRSRDAQRSVGSRSRTAKARGGNRR